jgi:hypothetical protein
METTDISLSQKEDIFWKIYNHICYITATEEFISLEETSIDLMEIIGYSISNDERIHLKNYVNTYLESLDLEEDVQLTKVIRK